MPLTCPPRFFPVHRPRPRPIRHPPSLLLDSRPSRWTPLPSREPRRGLRNDRVFGVSSSPPLLAPTSNRRREHRFDVDGDPQKDLSREESTRIPHGTRFFDFETRPAPVPLSKPHLLLFSVFCHSPLPGRRSPVWDRSVPGAVSLRSGSGCRTTH